MHPVAVCPYTMGLQEGKPTSVGRYGCLDGESSLAVIAPNCSHSFGAQFSKREAIQAKISSQSYPSVTTTQSTQSLPPHYPLVSLSLSQYPELMKQLR